MGPERRGWLIVVLVGGALAAYHLPWYEHATAGFTMNAFDLAEWASLHPAVRASTPPMLTSFLLRAPLLGLAVALALLANRLAGGSMRWWLRLAALAIVVRFLPPSDFFTSARADPNYRQMMLLSAGGAALIAIAAMLARLPARWQSGVLAGTLVAGAVAGWAGLARADVLLDNFAIAVAVGSGAIGYTACVALAAGLALLFPLPGADPARGGTVTAP